MEISKEAKDRAANYMRLKDAHLDKTAEEFKVEIRLILLKYKNDKDYDLSTAEYDIQVLMLLKEQYAQQRPSLRNEFIKFLMEIDECYACHIPENAKAVVDDYLKHSTEQRELPNDWENAFHNEFGHNPSRMNSARIEAIGWFIGFKQSLNAKDE